MESWGARCLTITWCIILIKAILSAIPIYQFFVILAPKYILNALVKTTRKFLWEGNKASSKKFHLVKWSTIRSAIVCGGLRIRDLALVNQALGATLAWKLRTNTHGRLVFSSPSTGHVMRQDRAYNSLCDSLQSGS